MPCDNAIPRCPSSPGRLWSTARSARAASVLTREAVRGTQELRFRRRCDRGRRAGGQGVALVAGPLVERVRDDGEEPLVRGEVAVHGGRECVLDELVAWDVDGVDAIHRGRHRRGRSRFAAEASAPPLRPRVIGGGSASSPCIGASQPRAADASARNADVMSTACASSTPRSSMTSSASPIPPSPGRAWRAFRRASALRNVRRTLPARRWPPRRRARARPRTAGASPHRVGPGSSGRSAAACP